jgi:hypothetical protein
MFVTCTYTEDKDRERLYMSAWRMQARFHTTLPPEDLEALMEIKRAFYLGAPYDLLVASHVERMASYLLRKRAYAW